MTRDSRQPLQQPYQHHQQGISGSAGHGAPRRGTMGIAGLSPDDGYDWLQRIGRTGATPAMDRAI